MVPVSCCGARCAPCRRCGCVAHRPFVVPGSFLATNGCVICRPRHTLRLRFLCHWQRSGSRPLPLASSKHKPQRCIFRKRKIPTVSWLLLFPQRPFVFVGTLGYPPPAALPSLPSGSPLLKHERPGTVDQTIPGFPRKERGLKMKE